jgi:hypothetical protein
VSGPGPGGVLVGIFLFLFGFCFLLAGGGCTIMWLLSAARAPTYALFGLPMLLLSGGVGVLGFVMIRAAGRMFRG